MKYIKSKRIYTEDRVIDGYIGIKDNKISCIVEGEMDVECEDYGNQRIIPGIIDTHNHGGVGYSFLHDDIDGILKCLKGQASYGVTGLFPTVVYLEQYKLFAEAMDLESPGAKMLGIHSEGPFGTRVGERADLKAAGYLDVDLEYIDKMLEICQDKIKLFDIAPEKPKALEAIKYLVEKGVTVSAYHTQANYEEANRGIDAGISVATHVGNVMTGLHQRDIGTFGACLFRDEVTCEMICDGRHLTLPMVKLILQLKDHDKIMMVSDSSSNVGAPVGKYFNGEETFIVHEDGFALKENGGLCGSSRPVLYGIGNLVEKLGLDLQEVIRFSSYNPAKKYNLTGKGSIKIGNDADLVVISDDYQALATYVEGNKVWDAEKETRPFNPEYLKFKID